jgi:hypothetical protein
MHRFQSQASFAISFEPSAFSFYAPLTKPAPIESTSASCAMFSALCFEPLNPEPGTLNGYSSFSLTRIQCSCIVAFNHTALQHPRATIKPICCWGDIFQKAKFILFKI